jgi:DNA-binding GntR family transcriptional regulator
MSERSNGPVTVTDYVANSIREWILSGKYTPGTRLDQQTLIDELGASLIPIRESLRQLEAEGFVRIYPHRGAFVAELSLTELQEIYFVREVLEETAAQLAVPNLSAQTLDELGELVENMERATATQDFAQLFDLNRKFHFAIYDACKNALLLQIINRLWDRSHRYRQLHTYLPERAPQALAEHREIYAACRASDSAAAGAAIRNNVRQTTVGILAKLQGKNK